VSTSRFRDKTQPDNVRFFSFWEGSELSLYEELCLASFLNRGFSINLYSYSPLRSRSGLFSINANDILPYPIFEKFNSLTSFSNHFRYVALHSKESGSTWVDLDVLCLSSNWPADIFLAGLETKRRINNAVLRVPGESSLLRDLINFSKKPENPNNFGETGPFLLTKLMEKNKGSLEPQPQEVFYPVKHWETNLLIDPNYYLVAKDRVTNSLAVHLYNELIIRAAIPKNMLPPKGSFLHEQFCLNIPKIEDTPILTQEWIKGWRQNYQERVLLNALGRKFGPLKRPIKKLVVNRAGES